MELRSELMPPALDESKVARLAKLAAELDGAVYSSPQAWEDDLAKFNRLAGTDLPIEEFQGIYGGEDHDSWIRKVLAGPYVKQLPDISRAELVELARRVMQDDGEEHETHFWLCMLEENLPDPRVSDLIYWPGEYFGDGDNSRVLTPEQVVDIAQARARGEGGSAQLSDDCGGYA
jgi:hypothetical protein